MRAAIYARVSTLDQHVENQLQELRGYAEARGWTATEFVDEGVSGAKDRRPALDELLKAAKRRKFDVVVCWRLDRLGRSLRHLILLLDELQAIGVAFVSISEGIDATTAAGRLQLHVLGVSTRNRNVPVLNEMEMSPGDGLWTLCETRRRVLQGAVGASARPRCRQRP
jgi:DNA invertase Pin-like site-specific DNA recombinase